MVPFWLQKTKGLKIVTTDDVKTMFRRLTNCSVSKSYVELCSRMVTLILEQNEESISFSFLPAQQLH